MILLCGIPSETPLAAVRGQLDRIGFQYVTFNQRRFMETDLRWEVGARGVEGMLRLDGHAYSLADFTGVYTRIMDDRLLPELLGEPTDSAPRRRCRSLHESLNLWFEVTPCLVVNRSSAMGSNISKPYQTQLIRACGFEIPETLVTNDPEAVLAFWEKHGRVIYKSISSVRSIVQTLKEEDRLRLGRVRCCPTQFQAYVEGTNTRVHTVGEAVFATAIRTEATDYRYAHQQGAEIDMETIELPDDIAERCVHLAQALELPFAGIDLKRTPDGVYYCFEVNPSPAFTYYEDHTGQPIAYAVAAYLRAGPAQRVAPQCRG